MYILYMDPLFTVRSQKMLRVLEAIRAPAQLNSLRNFAVLGFPGY